MRVAKPRVKTCRWCSFSPSTQDSQSYADHGCIDNPFNNNIQFHDVNRGLLDLLTVISWYKMHFLLIYQRVRMRMESLEKVSYVELVGLMNKSRHPSWLSRVLMTAPWLLLCCASTQGFIASRFRLWIPRKTVVFWEIQNFLLESLSSSGATRAVPCREQTGTDALVLGHQPWPFFF